MNMTLAYTVRCVLQFVQETKTLWKGHLWFPCQDSYIYISVYTRIYVCALPVKPWNILTLRRDSSPAQFQSKMARKSPINRNLNGKIIELNVENCPVSPVWLQFDCIILEAPSHFQLRRFRIRDSPLSFHPPCSSTWAPPRFAVDILTIGWSTQKNPEAGTGFRESPRISENLRAQLSLKGSAVFSVSFPNAKNTKKSGQPLGSFQIFRTAMLRNYEVSSTGLLEVPIMGQVRIPKKKVYIKQMIKNPLSYPIMITITPINASIQPLLMTDQQELWMLWSPLFNCPFWSRGLCRTRSEVAAGAGGWEGQRSCKMLCDVVKPKWLSVQHGAPHLAKFVYEDVTKDLW